MSILIKAITIFTVSTMLITSVYGEEVVVTEQQLDTPSTTVVGFDNFKIAMNSVLTNNDKYVSSTTITDKYGNIVSVKGKYEGEFYHFFESGDKPVRKVKTIQATRNGYKPIKFDLTLPKTTTIVLEPTATTQVTIGTIVLPEGTPKDNWWVELKLKNGGDSKEVYLKVKEDGSFKFLNLENGNYEVRIFRGTLEHGNTNDLITCVWDETHLGYKGNLIVNGNVNTAFDLRTKVVETTQITEFGTNLIDYANPSKYLQITSQLELDDETKKYADENFNDAKDITTIRQIMRHILNEYRDNNVASATDLDLIARDIVKQGYATGCTQFATLFQALCEYKGIPTVVVETLDLDWINSVNGSTGNINKILGHVYVECFVNGKWILIDPTSARLVENYAPGKQVIFDFSLNGTPIRHITLAKSTDISAMSPKLIAGAKKVFARTTDASKLNKLESITPNEQINRSEN